MHRPRQQTLKQIRAVTLVAFLSLILPLARQTEAADYLVANTTDILLTLPRVQPGDTVTMRDGIWVDSAILFNGNGTADNPITLRAQTPGQVILSGESSLRIAGNYLVIDGLKFMNGYLISGDVIAFRSSSSSVANNCRVTNCGMIDYNPDDPTQDTKWISLYGLSNRVDHCYLKGKNNAGSTVVVWVDNPERPNYHLIDHNYFGLRPPLGVNGGETIRVGTSDVSMNNSRTVVEYNYFEQCNGDAEIVSSKSCENIYRYNTFVDSEGVMSLRHGNRSSVYGNYFFGHGKPLTGGIRVVGEDHRVFNNYLEALGGSGSRAALSIMQGIENSPLNGYFQVQRALIVFNTIVNSTNSLIVGLSGTLTGTTITTTLPPLDCVIANNVILANSGKLVDQRIQPVNLTWEGNIMYGVALGIPAVTGINQVDPLLNLTDGLWRPATGSPVLGGAQGTYNFVTDDVEGHARPSLKDAGCDQASFGRIVRPPLTPFDVEPNWMQPGSVVLTWADPADITYGRPLGASQLNATANVPGSYDYTPSHGTILEAGNDQVLTVVFTPNDLVRYTVVTQSVLINVLPANPLLFWLPPTNLTYGTSLSGLQLSATASVPGQFDYQPPIGSILEAGIGQLLTVTFTPDDTNNYVVTTKSVSLDILPAMPVITWPAPAPIDNGTPLGPAQLNATANTPGTFVYSPPAGTVLSNAQTLSVVFFPDASGNYLIATQYVNIDVTIGGKLAPNVTWLNPADISAGTPLGPLQLNARADVPGTFIYTPAAGVMLSPGNGQLLSVTFRPNDANTYAAVTRVVRINVTAPLNNAMVRVAYLIPNDRVAQPDGVSKLQKAILFYQRWFREQMQRNGFGPKTFAVETEADGTTPKVYVVPLGQTDDYLLGDLWGSKVLDAARAAGVTLGTPGQLWWLIPEIHQQDPDGSVNGAFNFGYSYSGLPNDAGWAMTGGEFLALCPDASLTNNTAYDGLIVPGIGPYPLEQDVSFPWFHGTSLSSVSSAALGAGLRDLGEGLGLAHDFRNDENFNGNLMGYGYSGIRGAAFPRLYPYNYTRLSYGCALALNVSPFFNFGQPRSDSTKPNLIVTTSGATFPVNGLLRVGFSASDQGGLSAALLSWNKDSDQILVDEIKLSGTDAKRTFNTAYFDQGQTNVYTITVLDQQGNKQSATATLVPVNTFNQAPQVFVVATPASAGLGEDVVLDASGSFDSAHAADLLEVEWDLDGDGIFDTEPLSSLIFTNRYYTLGSRMVRARVSDPAGDTAVSAPVAVNITLCEATLQFATKSHGSGVSFGTNNVRTGFQCNWSSVSFADWIVPITSNGVGTANFTYTLAENLSLSSRTGTVLVADQIFTIIQNGIVCSYSFSPTNRFLGSGASANSVKITTKAPCVWAVDNPNDWIQIIANPSGIGTTNISYTISPNPSPTHRVGKVNVGNQFFFITQWGTACSYVLSPISWVHTASAETGMVSVASNSKCTWSVQNTNNWIFLTDNTNGTGSSTVGYSVSPNSTGGARTGNLTIAGQPFAVVQLDCAFSVSPTNLQFGTGPGAGQVSVVATGMCPWSVVNPNTWITPVTSFDPNGNGTVSLTIAPNPLYRTRTGGLNIAGRPVLVSQTGLDCTYSLSTNEMEHGATWEAGDVEVQTPGDDCPWHVVNTNEWITVLTDLSQTGNRSVIYTVDPNDGPARTGTLLIADLPYRITQERGVRIAAFKDIAVASGQTVCMPVLLETHGDENLLGFSLCYDSSLLAFSSARVGSGGGGGTLTLNTSQLGLGKLGLRLALPSGWALNAGTQTVVEVCFRAASITGNVFTAISGCDQPVPRQLVDVLGQSLPFTTADARARVVGFCTLGESLDAPTLNWTTDPAFPWLCQTNVTHDGVDAAQSGAIGNNASNLLQATVVGPANISFWWKVSSETLNDTLRFYIGNTEQARISGESGWQFRTSSVPAGTQVLQWMYAKNGSVVAGLDRAWVDQVQFQALPPSFSSQPAGQTVDSGTTATFSVGIGGGTPPFAYQWRFNGANLADNATVAGSTTSTLRLSNVQPNQAGLYSVVVANAGGSITSSNVFLNVIPLVPLPEALDAPPEWVWVTNGFPGWVGQPVVTHDGVDAARSGAIGDNQTNYFQSTINGPGTITFWWKVSSETNNDTLRFYIGSSEQARISGEVDWQQRVFSVPSGSQVLQWRYMKNSSGKAGEDRAWVDEVQFIPTAPTITTQPIGQNVDAGATVSFKVVAAGAPPLSYQWQLNGNNLSDGGNVSGSTSSNLTLANVQPGQAGSYSVVVGNATRSVTSASVLLTVATLSSLVEALDTPNLTWTTNGPSGWVGQNLVTHDTVDAARSGALGNSASNSMQTTVIGPVNMSFWWKVSSEPNNDFLRFSVGGVELARISGEVDWTFRSFDLGPGSQVLQWTYTKNGSVSNGQDRAWVDQVRLGPTPPAIVAQPVGQVAEIGGSVAFNVTVAGTLPFSYQWQFNGVNLADGPNISGSATPNLTLSNVQPGQSGNYSVVVTNTSGNVNSANAFLSVTPLLPLPEALDTPSWTWTTTGTPAWVGQSVVSHDQVEAARSGAIGDNASTSLQTILTGPGNVSFWWKVSSETNNDTLIFSIAGVEQARISGEVDWQFRTFGLSTTDPVVLQWTYAKNGSLSSGQDRAWLDQVQFVPGQAGFPLITSQPTSQTSGESGTAVFAVAASGAAPLSYQWLFNGATLVNSTSAVGVTTSSLLVSNITPALAGSYSVRVSNPVGVITSSVAVLTVVSFSDAVDTPSLAYVQGGTPPAWFAQTSVTHDGVAAAQSGAISPGVFTKFETHVNGPGPLSFWWKVSSLTNDGVLSLTIGSTVVLQVSGEVDWTPASFAVPSGTQLLKFRYQKGSGGGTAGRDAAWIDQIQFGSNSVPTPPSITVQPVSQSLVSPATVTFNVAAVGSTPLTYQWQFNGVNLVTGGNVSGASTPSLTLSSVTSAQAGAYSVVVSNPAGTANSSAAFLSVVTAPAITNQPASQGVVAGTTVTFNVGAIGLPPLAYQWRFNGTNLADSGNISGATNASLRLTSVLPAQAGVYSVLVTNPAGQVISSDAILTVGVPPAITSQPLNQTVAAGANVTFTVGAGGTAPLGYQWRLNGVSIFDGGKIRGASTATLVVSNVQSAQAGSYSVLVNNPLGSVTSSNAVLTVLIPPVITLQPISQTVAEGTNVTFTAAASGAAPLSYQWRFNGTNLSNGGGYSGVTSPSLTLANVHPPHNGNYSLAVSNPAGIGISSNALLRVIAALTLGDALNAPFLTWNSSLSAPWIAQTNVMHDSGGAARSGSISANQTSWLETVVQGPGIIRFWWKVSSETNHDMLQFLANGIPLASMSGEMDWQHPTFDLQAGSQTLRWVYSKDGSGSAGLDQAWLDEVELTPTIGPVSPLVMSQPLSQTVPPGATVAFSVEVSGTGPLSYQWRFNGKSLADNENVSGTTSDTLILANVQQTEAGTYDLVIRNNYTTATSSNAVLSVDVPIPLADALDTTNRVWIPAGYSRWTGQKTVTMDWIDAAQSGPLPPGQSNWIETTVAGPSAVTFWWKVSSETNHDRLRFSINGAEQANISGEVGWQWRTFDLTNASQIVRWAYTKDTNAIAAGLDRGWLDQVQFGPLAPTIVRQPVTTLADFGAMVDINVGVSGTPAINYQWHFNGVNLYDGPGMSGTILSHLIISNAAPVNSGVYNATVVNGGGRVITTNVTLSVTPDQPLAMAGDATNFLNSGFITSGDGFWTAQSSTTHDGISALQSGPISDLQKSSLFTTVMGPGKISFWWSVSSEANTPLPLSTGDTLRFYIAGTEQRRLSGITNWGLVLVDITNIGPQLLEWRYQKDATLSAGQDAGWIDQIQYAQVLPPILTNHPASTNVDPGSTVSLNVGAVGSPPFTYQWMRNGANLANGNGISGANSATLILANVQASQAGVYAAAVSNAAARVLSSNAVVTVTPSLPLSDALDIPAWNWATIGSPPWFGQSFVTHDGVDAARNALIGDGTSTSLQATQSGPGVVTFWWKVSSEFNKDFLQFFIGSTLQSQISGEVDWQQVSFNVPSGNQVLKWTYSKSSSGKAGQDMGWVDEVRFTGLPPSITSHPANQVVDTGANVSFTVGVSGTPPLTYQWRRNGSPLGNGVNIGGADTATLILTNVQPSQAGNYSVVVNNAMGSVTSFEAVLTVNPLLPLPEALDTPTWTWTTNGAGGWVGQSIVTHDGVDAGRSGAIGNNASGSMQTTVSGPGTVTFWWKVSSETNNDNLIFYSGSSGSSEQARISGEVGWQQRSFNISSGTQILKWTYSKNNNSTTGGLDHAWVDQVQFGPTPPSITTQPVGQTVDMGANVALNVVATGGSLTYQWQLNGGNLANGGNVNGVNTPTLTLANVQPNQAGYYSVIVSNSATSVSSVPVFVNVITLVSLSEALDTPGFTWTTNGTPSWVGQTAISQDGVDAARSGAIGNSATNTMQTTVLGPGTVSFWWKVSSETNNDTLRFLVGGVEQARISGEVDWQWRSFNINSGNQVLQWAYIKNGSSSAGQDRAWVDQVQLGATAPFITVQPLSQAADMGATVTFSVSAGGTPPFSYQWRLDGTDLVDGGPVSGSTTANLVLSNVQPGPAGTYSVVISNTTGRVTSSNAVLTVTPLLPLPEALDTPTWSWITNGPSGWVGQSSVTQDGVDAGRSGAMGNNASNSMQTTVIGPGTVTFWWKVSSEINNDTLRFSIAGVEQARISGEVNWQARSFNVPSGSQVLQWTYAKNGSVTAGQDRAWVDQVQYVPSGLPVPPVITIQPVSQNVGEGSIVTFTAAASGPTPFVYQWQFNGVNLVDNPTNVAGSTSSTLIRSNTLPSAGGAYALIVSNPFGSVTSSVANLAVPLTLADAVDAPAITFSMAGFCSWIAQTTDTHDGVDAARSGVTPDGQNSRLETWVNGPGTVSFWWKVSCEANDNLRFVIGSTEQNRISGEVNWQFQTYSVPAGLQLMKWRYGKDSSGSAGQDAGWVDQISYVPVGGLIAPPPHAIVANIQMSTNNVVLTWELNQGRSYKVFYKTDLLEADWRPLDAPVLLNGSAATVTDVFVDGQPNRFYLIMEY